MLTILRLSGGNPATGPPLRSPARGMEGRNRRNFQGRKTLAENVRGPENPWPQQPLASLKQTEGGVTLLESGHPTTDGCKSQVADTGQLDVSGSSLPASSRSTLPTSQNGRGSSSTWTDEAARSFHGRRLVTGAVHQSRPTYSTLVRSRESRDDALVSHAHIPQRVCQPCRGEAMRGRVPAEEASTSKAAKEVEEG